MIEIVFLYLNRKTIIGSRGLAGVTLDRIGYGIYHVTNVLFAPLFDMPYGLVPQEDFGLYLKSDHFKNWYLVAKGENG